MSKPSHLIRTLISLLVIVVFVAPLTLLVSIYGTRLGYFDIATGFGFIGLKLVPILSWVSLGAGALACLLLLRDRSAWPMAVIGLLIGVVMVGGVAYQTRSYGSAPRDVTTNLDDVPAFAGRLAHERRNMRAPEHVSQTCEGLDPVNSQLAYESVAWGLDRAGVTVMGASPFRVDGWTEDNFYGVRHDVTVRIRPGRTDVRVSGRDSLPIGDQACELALKIVSAMNEAYLAQ